MKTYHLTAGWANEKNGNVEDLWTDTLTDFDEVNQILIQALIAIQCDYCGFSYKNVSDFKDDPISQSYIQTLSHHDGENFSGFEYEFTLKDEYKENKDEKHPYLWISYMAIEHN